MIDFDLRGAFTDKTYKCVLSAPRGELLRAVVSKKGDLFHLEKQTKTQVFHENLPFYETKNRIISMLNEDFMQLTSWDDRREHRLKITKKWKALYSSSPLPQDAPAPADGGHNREKKYLLPPGEIVPPLVDMGVFTAEGAVVGSMYDKFRQINRFLEIIDDEVKKLGASRLSVLDFGCGKSYLTFILYHYLVNVRGIEARVTGLDLKADVVEKCNAAARKYGYAGLRFEVGDIARWQPEDAPDMVISLHACDTATDFALFSAISWDAKLIFAVPCCQHELNGQVSSERLSAIMRYGIIKERFAALATDAIRANLLEHCGYKTQVLEFVDLAHTPKNLLIRAVKRHGKPDGSALREALTLMEEINAKPTLYNLLRDAGRL